MQTALTEVSASTTSTTHRASRVVLPARVRAQGDESGVLITSGGLVDVASSPRVLREWERARLEHDPAVQTCRP